MVNERNGEQFGFVFCLLLFVSKLGTLQLNQIVNKNKSHTFPTLTKATLQLYFTWDNNTDSPKPQNRFFAFESRLFEVWSEHSPNDACPPVSLCVCVYSGRLRRVRCTPRSSDRSLSSRRIPLPTWWLHANQPFWNSLILEFECWFLMQRLMSPGLNQLYNQCIWINMLSFRLAIYVVIFWL